MTNDGKPRRRPDRAQAKAEAGAARARQQARAAPATPRPDATTADAPPSEATAPGDGERIAKVLARAGMCSRRDAERAIAEGRVRLNGVVVATPATFVKDDDRLSFDGQPVPAAAPARLWRYHKPRGLMTTHRDPEGRPTVFETLPETMPRVISIGRLDLNSEGLLLLTNDGALAREMTLPSSGWVRRYKVRVFGQIDPARLAALADGVTIDGVRYGAIQIEIDREGTSNAWLNVALTEGKNREIRRVMEHLDLSVNRLVRVAYGPFDLGTLKPGAVAAVPRAVLYAALRGEEPAPRPARRQQSPRPSPDARAKADPPRKGGGRRAKPSADTAPRGAGDTGAPARTDAPRKGPPRGPSGGTSGGTSSGAGRADRRR